MAIKIVENMRWPILDNLYLKMLEHAAWFSGDPNVLANFYSTAPLSDYTLFNNNTFWARQAKKSDNIVVHVPIANDISETSANLLFSEAPILKISEAEVGNNLYYQQTQDILFNMLNEVAFYRKLLEAAEAASAIGGIFIKLAWDLDLSPYPIPTIVQADKAIPEFKFGYLTSVIFWQELDYYEDASKTKVFRLLEYYEPGQIRNELWLGTADRIGKKVALTEHEKTADLPEIITFDIKDVLAVYVPNILPNRLNRHSYIGRSDYHGLETLMDKLDETFTAWAKEITLAQPKILLPETFLKKTIEGTFEYDYDQNLFVKLDIDPVTVDDKIIPQQFDIRAEQFEKTALNLIERIITSAGYSPQSFGLNIAGRAESGTALSIRERKSFATKVKKEKYWGPAIKKLIKLMLAVYSTILNGKTIENDFNLVVEFSDSITNNLNEIAQSIKMLTDAMAISTITKVRLLHPEWDEIKIQEEANRIMEENNIGKLNPPDNLDMYQLQNVESNDA
jgi:A118 family predicted phage portal protein